MVGFGWIKQKIEYRLPWTDMNESKARVKCELNLQEANGMACCKLYFRISPQMLPNHKCYCYTIADKAMESH
jgi:hypothetical protein